MRRVGALGVVVIGAVLIVWIGLASRRPGPDVAIVPYSPAPMSTIAPGMQSRTVNSVATLLDALADDELDEIVVANGTYRVSPASEQRADSLWIGSRYASRTRPIVVRAETRGGVIFDGGGAAYFGGISFEEGVHDQTWDGFVFSGGRPTDTGVVVFGGYRGQAAPYNITMRSITLTATLTGIPPRDQGIYISNTETDGPHDLLFEDITVDGVGGLTSAFAIGHDWGAAAHDVTIRRLTVDNAEQAYILWSTPALRNITLDGARITNARKFAIRYEADGDPFVGIVIKDVISSGSADGGFFSTGGQSPPGLTIINSSLN